MALEFGSNANRGKNKEEERMLIKIWGLGRQGEFTVLDGGGGRAANVVPSSAIIPKPP